MLASGRRHAVEPHLIKSMGFCWQHLRALF